MKNIMESNEARDNGLAVVSAGPHANHFYFAPAIISAFEFLQARCSV